MEEGSRKCYGSKYDIDEYFSNISRKEKKQKRKNSMLFLQKMMHMK